MVVSVNIDHQRKQLYFEDFPNELLDYQETAQSNDSDLVHLQSTDEKTGKVLSVFIKGTELQRVGISLTVWKKLANKPEKLLGLIKNTATIDGLLQRAAAIASEHLPREFLTFFTDRRTFANRIIISSMHQGGKHLSGLQGVPGMYFHYKGSEAHIFINLKKTPPLGAGTFGKVRKVLWLSVPQQSSVLAVKKVFKDKAEKSNFALFKREILALREFSNKTGIISLIAGEVFDDKCAIFLPIYECDLYTYLVDQPFSLTNDEVLSMISQWLEGLATISEKGMHGDLSLNNLLIKRLGGGKVEAVISDFGSFCSFGRQDEIRTSIRILPPEYFERKMVTSKQDVWSMGIALHQVFSKQSLPLWAFDTKTEIAQWVSELSPGWSLLFPSEPTTPQFLLELINGMLDPRHAHRLSAKEAFEQFSKGLASYYSATSQDTVPETGVTDTQ